MKKYVKPEIEQIEITPEESIAKTGSVCEEIGACPGGNNYWDYDPVAM